jgi:hypothetical protein
MKITKEEIQQIEDDYEEESFSWWNWDDELNYFVLTTKFKADYRAGDQFYNCYGRRSNRFLLAYYGFCLAFNKYNSVQF